ncbi:legume-like lectin family-domain-containing protein [Gorgonomyces haynaldii]|nr:legume-like lectin family-domain-containing protein [Gorgonomyces haynaldii]
MFWPLVAAQVHQSHFSLHAPYLESSLRNPNYDYGKDTVVEVNRYVRLTPDTPSKEGNLWSIFPQHASSWQVEFEFKVGYDGTMSGDGFAFWYTKQRGQSGQVFGSQDYFEGLGIFFDTYPNARQRASFPWVMAMVGDGRKSYDHDTDGKQAEIPNAGCPTEFRNKDHPTKARVTYVKNKYLRVELDVENSNTWRECFTVDAPTLPDNGYYGFSALTGGVSAKHDIISVDVYSLQEEGTKKEDDYRPPPPQQQQKQVSKESSASILFYILILIILCVVGYVAWNVYQQSKQQSYKRF